MNFHSIFLAALSGGVAVLIASALFGKQPNNKKLYSIVVIVLFLALNSICKQLILPKIQANKTQNTIEAVFSSVPAFVSIKEYEPELYKQIVASLSNEMKDDYDRQKALDFIREKISSLVATRMPHASDEALINYISVMVREIEELYQHGGGMCYEFMFPDAGFNLINPTDFLSKEIKQKDLLAINDVIKTSNTKKYIPSETRAMSVLEPIFSKLHSKHGETMIVMENPKYVDRYGKDTVCEIAIDLYNMILNLPPEDSADSLRWMFSQPDHLKR